MKEKLNKIFKIGMIVFAVFSIMCPVIYNIIGSKVLEDGTLVEPFYLTVFGWIFFALFIISLVNYFLTRGKTNEK